MIKGCATPVPASSWRGVCYGLPRPGMLRRRFMLTLVPLIALLLATVVAAVWLLQNLLGDLRHVAPGNGAAIEQLTTRLQWLVLGLALVFLLVINIAVLVLLK